MPSPISREKPHPAHPDAREIEQPWKTPKRRIADPKAPGLIDATLQSPEYGKADQDVAFLPRDENREVRLQLGCPKPERPFAEHGSRHSIVVFGGTRIAEPGAAQQKVAAPGSRLAASPGDHDLSTRFAVARRVLDKSRYDGVAREFDRIVGRAVGCAGNRIAIITGGFGTMDELWEAPKLIRTRKIPPLPVILVGRSYWERAFDREFFVAEGVIDPEDPDLFCYAETAPDICDDIQRWCRRAGQTLI